MTSPAERAGLENYSFQKYIDEQKHLDTDELRHTIKPVVHVIDKDFKGEKHIFCDKDQRCPLGTFRRPKHVIEAEKRGFTSGLEMVEADKNAEEKAKKDREVAKDQELDDIRKQLAKITALLHTLE